MYKQSWPRLCTFEMTSVDLVGDVLSGGEGEGRREGPCRRVGDCDRPGILSGESPLLTHGESPPPPAPFLPPTPPPSTLKAHEARTTHSFDSPVVLLSWLTGTEGIHGEGWGSQSLLRGSNFVYCLRPPLLWPGVHQTWSLLPYPMSPCPSQAQ